MKDYMTVIGGRKLKIKVYLNDWFYNARNCGLFKDSRSK